MSIEDVDQDEQTGARREAPSTSLWAFIHNGPYFLSEITVYSVSEKESD